jgi:hypothetical protein
MERVLAFGCHPDDIEFSAGGEAGSPDLRPQDIRARRLQEAAASAAVLGARCHYAGGQDLEIEYNQAQRRQAVRVLREVDMLAAHASQREWLAYINENMKQGSARDGKRISRPMGECFIQHRGMVHPADNILAKVLGELCVSLEG